MGWLQQKGRLRKLVAISFMVAVWGLFVQSNNLEQEIARQDLTILAGRRIAIDPGHGGIDDGASRYGLAEKDITLEISLRLAAVLRDYGASITMTRENDIDYYKKGKGGKRHDLLQRVAMIQESGAELFVSIHTNASNDSRWSGAQVFYNPKLVENKLLGEAIQVVLQKFPPNNKREAKQDSDILVLNANSVPGVLVETGFLSNRREATLLTDEHYQQELVLNIARALAYHIAKNKAP